jgi:branched-chain amino acid aminotransferase
MAVSIFALEGGVTTRLGESRSLSEASSSLPSGAYTSLRTYRGNRVLRLEQHLGRLEESVALQGQPARLDAEAVRSALRIALAATGHPDSRLRLTFAPPRIFVSVEPFEPLAESLYRDGVACATLPFQRDNPHSKDTRFIATASGAYDSLPGGVHEGLLVAEDRSVLEGLSSNFFAVRMGALYTEEDRALLGITRSLVLEVAAGLLPVEHRAVRKPELAEASEAFLTSVSREVLPVVAIDGLAIGGGRPGPRTRAIMAAFADLVRKEAELV